MTHADTVTPDVVRLDSGRALKTAEKGQIRRNQLMAAVGHEVRLSLANWAAALTIVVAGASGVLFLVWHGPVLGAVALASATATLAAAFFRNYMLHERKMQFYQLELGDLENRLLGFKPTPIAMRERAYFHMKPVLPKVPARRR